MDDLFLYLSGGLGVTVSIVHGYLGETRIVRPVVASSAAAKRVLSAIMFLSAVYWFCAGALVLSAPTFFPGATRSVIAFTAAGIFLSGALGNFWATRGRHFGWALLALCCGLAIAGA
ncbi:MAG: hypothetical protein AAGC56_09015 [Pseudomonadota bacterium]